MYRRIVCSSRTETWYNNGFASRGDVPVHYINEGVTGAPKALLCKTFICNVFMR